MKTKNGNWFKLSVLILYWFFVLLMSVLGIIINVAYDFDGFQIFYIITLCCIPFLIPFSKRLRHKLTSLYIEIVLLGIIIIPFSIEFFTALLDMRNAHGIYKIVASPVAIFPLVIFVFISKWITDYKLTVTESFTVSKLPPSGG